MCQKRNSVYNAITETKIDKCMDNIISFVNKHPDFRSVGCCCGHGVYPITIVVEHKPTGLHYELFSNKLIDRKRRFYKKDKNGYYYIPEVIV